MLDSFIHRLTALYHQYLIEATVALIVVVVVLFIQVGREAQAKDWPQKWSFRHRIQFQRFEHAVPLFSYPGGGNNRFLPHLGTANNLLHSGDSISKQPGADRFLLIRDHAGYRVADQWVWNKTTRDFEFAGRDSTRL
jgi:hypothetical protein